jgi:riboflavin biosynthesis pyrimidine reductase
VRALWPVPSDELDDETLDAYYSWPDGRWLRSNMVESVDGAAQSPGGGTQTMSSAADRRVLGTIRALADAVIVGAGTARTEGYRTLRPRERYVTRRHENAQLAAPVLVLVSHSLDLDPASALFADDAIRTTVATVASAPTDRAQALRSVADVIVCGDTVIDLDFLLGTLTDRGLTRLVAEGGPHLLGALLAAGLVDDMAVTIAPHIAGDYADHAPSRIVSGHIIDGSNSLRLAHLLIDDDSLFARYEVVRP